MRVKTTRISSVALFVLICVAASSSVNSAFVPHPSPARTAANNVEQLARSVTIYRDTYGVPHIYGPTDRSVVFGFAYAQAEDNFWQIEDNYIRSLGRASEVHGAKMLPETLLNRALEISKISMAEYERASPKTRALCDAVADGLNYYLARNPAAKPRLLSRFEPWYVLAFTRYAIYQLFVANQAGFRIEEMRGAVGQVAQVVEPETDLEQPIGSNMWAINGAKSANGQAMLFINPHQPFFGPGQWYEGHIESKEGWSMSGATLLGLPFPVIGHNQNLGWSHTVNTPDIWSSPT
jgi:penicillin amidase